MKTNTFKGADTTGGEGNPVPESRIKALPLSRARNISVPATIRKLPSTEFHQNTGEKMHFAQSHAIPSALMLD